MTPDEPLQLGLEGMPRRLFACTPSRLTTWDDCPRRYRFTYLDRPASSRAQAWAHTTLGAAVHVALARWWTEPRGRRTPAVARALLERAWPRPDAGTDGFADAAQSERERERAAGMVERYVASLDPGHEPVAVERTVSARTDRLALTGRVDRVDERGDGLAVVDYKTGRRVPSDADAAGSLQLALYAFAAGRALRRACHRVELHHLPTGRVAVFDHTDVSLDRHLTRAEATADEITAATQRAADGGELDVLFPPRTSSGCSWCEHVRACPEGRVAAGAPKRPWDGLAEQPSAPDEAA